LWGQNSILRWTNTEPIQININKIDIKIKFDDKYNVYGYVFQSQITNLFYIDNSIISQIFSKNSDYKFQIIRFDDVNGIVEVSRKGVLELQSSNLHYKDEYIARIINKNKSYYVIGYDFEGILINDIKNKYIPSTPVKLIVANKNSKIIEFSL